MKLGAWSNDLVTNRSGNPFALDDWLDQGRSLDVGTRKSVLIRCIQKSTVFLCG
jgi:hypothetical protein